MLRILRFFIVACLFSSCKILTPQVMFKTDKKNLSSDTSSTLKNREYLLAPNDKFEMNLYSIEGYKLVDITASAGGGQSGGISYIIELDGTAKLPIQGKIQLSGLTLREAEKYLEE